MTAAYTFAERFLIPIQLVLAMVGMGATLTLKDFAVIARDPRGLALGLGLQLVFVPALAVGFIAAFGLSKGWAVGLLLVAVVPGGAWSNLLTYLGKANVPLSISVTTASTLGCIVSIPLLLELLAGAHLPEHFVLPTRRIIFEIFAYLLVPLSAGMVLLRAAPRAAPVLSVWAIRTSVLFIVLITVAALGSGRMKFAEYGWMPAILLISFGLVLVNATLQGLRLLGCYDDDNLALSIEVTIRNVGVALLMVPAFFPGEEAQGHVLYTCLFYAGLSFFLAVPAVLRHRKGGGAAPLRAPNPRPG